MEFIFIPIILLVVGISTLIYRSDRPGWNKTFKRLSSNVRASIEFKKDKDKMLPMLDSDEWTRQFEGKPVELPEEKKKHVIVRTDFERTYLGDWPRWKCKCGVSHREPVLPAYGLQEAIKDAKKSANQHVKDANKNEEIKDQYKAKGITGREW